MEAMHTALRASDLTGSKMKT